MTEQQMTKAKWHRLPAFTIPLFQSAHVYLAITREQYQNADKFLGGSGEEGRLTLVWQVTMKTPIQESEST
jgi:hypothetical protein